MVKRSHGYTLTEVMASVAIIGILSGLTSKLMIQAQRNYLMSKTRTELQREARSVMFVIQRNIRQAQSSSITIDQASSQPYYSRISFLKIQGNRITFSQSGTKLLMTDSSNRTTTLSSNVQYLAFSFPRSDDLTIVSVSVTLQELLYEGKMKALHMASEKVRVMD